MCHGEIAECSKTPPNLRIDQSSLSNGHGKHNALPVAAASGLIRSRKLSFLL